MRDLPAKQILHSSRSTAAILCVSAVVATATACSNSNDNPRIIAPAARSAADASANNRNVSVHWNEIARDLVAVHNTNGPLASRVYALVSVAQFRSARATGKRKVRP